MIRAEMEAKQEGKQQAGVGRSAKGPKTKHLSMLKDQPAENDQGSSFV